MITLTLVIMGLLQNRRIQELVDIVKELRDQTTELKVQSEVLTKRYELEQILSLKDRIPYFQKDRYWKARFDHIISGDTYELLLVNAGTNATQTELIDADFNKDAISAIEIHYGRKDIAKAELLTIRIKCSFISVEPIPLYFSFSLTFMDDPGNKFKQIVRCVGGVVSIAPPQSAE